MKIIEIREKTVPIASDIRNAVVNFSSMTVSVVKIITDQSLNGRPLVGYAFSSNGRYAQGGILRERIIPRLVDAAAADLLTEDGSNLNPFKCWDVMMTDEKPGGHGERSVAVGVLDMAIWDVVAKVERVPLYRLLADRYCAGNADADIEVYAAGGYYYPGQDGSTLRPQLSTLKPWRNTTSAGTRNPLTHWIMSY